MGLDLEHIRQFAFHLKVKGAYVQDPGDKGQIIGLNDREFLFSVDATALYPSTMITNNISEETLYGRVYDNIMVDKLLQLIKAVAEHKVGRDQALAAFDNAIKTQFTEYAKVNKIAKQKEVVAFNIEYYNILFKRLVSNINDFEKLLVPKSDQDYYLLKSHLMPILDAIVWTSPLNPGYSRTIVDYVFFPEYFEENYKGAWVLENIYSPKSTLNYYSKDDLKEKILSKYLLNTFGTLFYKHKDKIAEDVLFLDDSMSNRKKIKNRMLVFEQLLSNIETGNPEAEKLALLIKEKRYQEAEKLLESAGVKKIMDNKKVNVEELEILGNGDIKQLLKLTIFSLNLTQLAIKVFMNSGFGIKGLITFPFSAPALGNSITTSAKIYGIKVAQNVAAQVIDNWNLTP